MCSQARCRTCGKITWSGCGSHVNMVLAGVPDEQRCKCDPNAKKQNTGIFGNIFG